MIRFSRIQALATSLPLTDRVTKTLSGKIKSIAAGIATVEAGEENDSRPLSLKVGRDILTIAEDADRRLAGYTCGANGSVEGDYRRVQRLR